MYVSPSSHCAASAALSAPPALQQWRERTCTWFHAPVAEPARDGQTTPLVIRGHLLAAPTWHTPQTLAEPVASDALTALLKAPHHGLQEHRYCKPSATGQFKFMSGQQRFHASYAVDDLPGSELVCHFAVTDPAGKKLVEFGTPPVHNNQAEGPVVPARRPRSTLDQLRLSRSFADAPARALWNTWTRTGLDLQLNVIRLQADEKLHCKVPAGLTEVIPLQKRQLAARAMREIIRSGRVAAGQLHGVLRFYDPENALKGKKYLAEFHLAAAPSGPEAVQYEMRSLTVKDFSGQVVLHADLDAPASARHQATTSGADRAELSAAPLSETEHKAYTEHMQTQKRALLNGAQSPAVIVSCLAAMNAKGLAGGTTCMLHEDAAALTKYLRDFPKHPDYVVAVLGDVDPLLEDAARVHFTAGIVHRDAGAYSMAFVDPRGKIENLDGLSAAEHFGAKAAVQAWLHVQNDGENCAHFAMRFAEHAAQEDVRAEIVGKLDALADGNAPKSARINRTGETWTCALTGAEESSFFFPIQFFKEIQWSTVLGELLAAHHLEGDRWDEIAVSTKSLDGKAGMTIEEHYHYNKERLGVDHSRAITLKAKKDRKAALEFIQALEKMPDGGAAAWKAALVQLSPWLTPGGDVTDSVVGRKLATKPIELHKLHHEDDDQYLSSSDESLAELARRPPPLMERSTGWTIPADEYDMEI